MLIRTVPATGRVRVASATGWVGGIGTRERSDLKLGLSPRAGQGLLRAAQAWAYLADRPAVLPEDVQAVLPAVVAHRLERRDPTGGGDGDEVAREIIRAVPVPP